MRIAVLSDIHGNLTALEAVLRDVGRMGVDVIVHGGDLVANGARPADVVDLIREFDIQGVRGNTDEMLWRPDLLPELESKAPAKQGLRRVLFNDIAPATTALLGADRLSWLQTLPLSWSSENVTVLHASPNDLWRAPLADAPDETLEAVYVGARTEAVIYGHIHRPFVRRLHVLTVANTGSVGLPYDGDPRASYLLQDGGNVVVRRVEYDIDREARLLLSSLYPHAEWLASILRTGTYRPPF